jgi:hypothetical protein
MQEIILNNMDQMITGDYPHQTEQATYAFQALFSQFSRFIKLIFGLNFFGHG